MRRTIRILLSGFCGHLTNYPDHLWFNCQHYRHHFTYLALLRCIFLIAVFPFIGLANAADTLAPTLAVVTPISASTKDTTPSFTFSSTEAGSIIYGGSCSSPATTMVNGNKTITLDTLMSGTYSSCTIKVKDAAGNTSTALLIPKFTIDTSLPVLSITLPVKTITNDTTPSFTLNSSDAGSIIYGGACTSVVTTSAVGNKTITFNTLVAGTYNNCTVKVKDNAGNVSAVLSIPPFTIDTTLPVLSVVAPIPSLTKDTTPAFTFGTTEAGKITYVGLCSAGKTAAVVGNNTVTMNALVSGSYSTCKLTVEDVAGNKAVLAIPAFRIDDVIPTLSLISPVPLYTKDTTPSFIINSNEAGTLVYSGACSSTATSSPLGNKSITLTTLLPGTYSNCAVSLKDAAGNVSPVVALPAFTIDTTLPALSVVTPVPALTKDTTPSFTFNTSEAGTLAYPGSCVSATTSALVGINTISFKALASGTYSTCTLQLVDKAGNKKSLTIAPFTVDVAAPVLSIVSAIPKMSNDTTPGFVLNSSEKGSLVWGGACTSATKSMVAGNAPLTLNALLDGTYSNCTVKVVDGAGNASTVVALPSFTIDTKVPVLAVVTPVAPLANDATPNFTFNTTKAGAITYSGSCDSIKTTATVGNNTLTLNALGTGKYSDCKMVIVDAAGNSSLALALPAFTIDTLAPVLQMITPVAAVTNDATPSFTINSSKAGNFVYSGSCVSSLVAIAGGQEITYKALQDGTYSTCGIAVKDAAGNVSNKLILSSFIVDTKASVLKLVAPIPSVTNNPKPEFTLSSGEAGALVLEGACSTSQNAVNTGNNKIQLELLADGTYSSCGVKVIDAAGNVSVGLGIPTFSVDTQEPLLAVVKPVLSPTTDDTPQYAFSSTEIGKIIYSGDCQSATLNAVSGNNTISFTEMALGLHDNCSVAVVDVAGNFSEYLPINGFKINPEPFYITGLTYAATTSAGDEYKISGHGLSKVTLSLNGTALLPVAQNAHEVLFVRPELAAGEYALDVKRGYLKQTFAMEYKNAIQATEVESRNNDTCAWTVATNGYQCWGGSSAPGYNTFYKPGSWDFASSSIEEMLKPPSQEAKYNGIAIKFTDDIYNLSLQSASENCAVLKQYSKESGAFRGHTVQCWGGSYPPLPSSYPLLLNLETGISWGGSETDKFAIKGFNGNFCVYNTTQHKGVFCKSTVHSYVAVEVNGARLYYFGGSTVGGFSINTKDVQSAVMVNKDSLCYRGSMGHYDCLTISSNPNQYGTFTLDGDRLLPYNFTDIFPDAIYSTKGSNHACLVVSDGLVKCWGNNDNGQLGLPYNRSPHPVTVSHFDDVTSFSATERHICARHSGGKISCIGVSRRMPGFRAEQPEWMTLTNVANVSVASTHACALLSNGTVNCWGVPDNGRTGMDVSGNNKLINVTGSASVSVGGEHSCALLTDKTIRCWGAGVNGQLGDGTAVDSAVPLTVYGIANAVQIATGDQHSCALLSDGKVKCWGSNQYGQLGNGTLNNSVTPYTVSGLTSVASIALGQNRSCAALQDKTVTCWGNGEGVTAKAVAGLVNVEQVSVASTHTCAQLTDKTVKCWGDNSFGQLGDNTFTNSSTPVDVLFSRNVMAITTSEKGSCALLDDGYLQCWGMLPEMEAVLSNPSRPVYVP